MCVVLAKFRLRASVWVNPLHSIFVGGVDPPDHADGRGGADPSRSRRGGADRGGAGAEGAGSVGLGVSSGGCRGGAASSGGCLVGGGGGGRNLQSCYGRHKTYVTTVW